jgi:carboxy-terminal domain RNA polymerase II polypeptide A small phosphatase
MQLHPQRPLLILDLDETLVHARETAPADRPPCDFTVFSFPVWRRPHLAEFLLTAGAWFDLALWTAATPPYAQAIVERIIPAELPLRFVWTRAECTRRLERERGA